MSLVALGPLTQVCGRPGSSRANASGTPVHDLFLTHQAHMQVGDEAERAPSLTGPVREYDHAGDRDAYRRKSVV